MIKTFNCDDTFGKKTMLIPIVIHVYPPNSHAYLGSDSEDVLLPTRLRDASCLWVWIYPVVLLTGTLLADVDKDILDKQGSPPTASLEYLMFVYSLVLFCK